MMIKLFPVFRNAHYNNIMRVHYRDKYRHISSFTYFFVYNREHTVCTTTQYAATLNLASVCFFSCNGHWCTCDWCLLGCKAAITFASVSPQNVSLHRWATLHHRTDRPAPETAAYRYDQTWDSARPGHPGAARPRARGQIRPARPVGLQRHQQHHLQHYTHLK